MVVYDNDLQKPEINDVSSVQKSQLLAGDLTGSRNSHLEFIRNLLDYWQKGQNAVIIDDQVSLVICTSVQDCLLVNFSVFKASAWYYNLVVRDGGFPRIGSPCFLPCGLGWQVYPQPNEDP